MLLHVITLGAAATFACGYLYLVALYCFAIWRTRQVFFWILALSSTAFLIFAAVDVLLLIAGQSLRMGLGAGLFATLYTAFIAIQPVALFIALLGLTLMVQFIV